MSGFTVLTIPIIRKVAGAFNGVAYDPSTPAPIGGGPWQARHYRVLDKTIIQALTAVGNPKIDDRHRLSFLNPLAPIAVNDTPPVPNGLLITSLTASVAAGSGASVTVDSTTGIAANQWVFLGNDRAQEAVQVISVVDGTHFTADVTNAHGSGESVIGAILALVIRVRGPYSTCKQVDLEVGTVN